MALISCKVVPKDSKTVIRNILPNNGVIIEPTEVNLSISEFTKCKLYGSLYTLKNNTDITSLSFEEAIKVVEKENSIVKEVPTFKKEVKKEEPVVVEEKIERKPQPTFIKPVKNTETENTSVEDNKQIDNTDTKQTSSTDKTEERNGYNKTNNEKKKNYKH